jgi:FkbM family methyltransferase
MNPRLIFDLGMNNGDDTEYYLKKGFEVVAVEANPQLCEMCTQRFGSAVSAGRLHILNRAVAAEAGTVQFFVNESVSGWSTIDDRWRQTRQDAQTNIRVITIPAVTMGELVRQHGMPYYVKVDIQGAELVCLRELVEVEDRPAYVSVSAGSDVLRDGALEHVRQQLELLAQLGYCKFKIVPQQETHLQTCPHPALEGTFVVHRFPHGSSGMFGRELPGIWLDASAALKEHRRIITGYRYAGHSRSPAAWFTNLPSERLKRTLDRLFWRGLGWYDTHAAR